MGSLGYRRFRWCKIGFHGAPGCFRGTWVYIGGRSRSVDARGAHEGGGALDPRGCLVCFLTSTPSLLDCVCSKKSLLKVSGKLLITHRRGLGGDGEALHGRFPLRQSAGEGSKMGSRGYIRLRWWKLCFVVPLDVFGVRRYI